jgi:CDP-paratose 2-epimerase
LKEVNGAFQLDASRSLPIGISAAGVSEDFSSAAPVSLYGATKLASEALALEYFHSFQVPVWINRCGVLAGAGQFGHPAQGIFAYWIHAHKRRRPLKYIGFGGSGHQVRDVLHPLDLTGLLALQMSEPVASTRPRLLNLSGGAGNSLSLFQLTSWCDERFGPHPVMQDAQPRPLDIPWLILDSGRAQTVWNWQPRRTSSSILEELAQHAEANPDWLDLARA